MAISRGKSSMGLFEFLTLVAICLLVLLIASLCGGTGCYLPSHEGLLVWQLRAPRALSAFAVGGLLSLAGALMQLLLRNPLADPYVLGVSGGAAAGALSFSLLLPVSLALYRLPLGALFGALLATALLFLLARRTLMSDIGMDSVSGGVRLILTGVMISAGFGAIITLLLAMSTDVQLRGTLFWLMGELDSSEFSGIAWAVLLIASGWAFFKASALNMLSHGELTAHLLGLSVRRLQTATLLVASLSTAAAVTVAGTIGFIGLIVPHALRLLIGNDQRMLLPATVLAGGIALTLADLLARTVVAPVQLPVGVITALVGVPVFLVLLLRSRTWL